jgi:hypothetical protein
VKESWEWYLHGLVCSAVSVGVVTGVSIAGGVDTAGGVGLAGEVGPSSLLGDDVLAVFFNVGIPAASKLPMPPCFTPNAANLNPPLSLNKKEKGA